MTIDFQHPNPDSESDEESERFLLTDLNIATVGIVARGAQGVFNQGRNFFMLKSQKMEDQNMAEESTIIVDGEPIEKEGFLNWIKEQLGLHKSDEKDPVGEEEVTSPPPEPTPEPIVAKSDDMTAILKNMQDQIATIQKESQAQIMGLQTQLQKTQEELAEERAKTQKQEIEKAEMVFVEKAEQLPTIVLNPFAMGKALYKASTLLEKDDYEVIYSALDRAENLLKQTQLWDEVGSTQIDESGNDPLAKAQKMAKEQGISLKDAILALPTADQMLIKSERNGGKRR